VHADGDDRSPIVGLSGYVLSGLLFQVEPLMIFLYVECHSCENTKGDPKWPYPVSILCLSREGREAAFFAHAVRQQYPLSWLYDTK